jgi:hypothetical protein
MKKTAVALFISLAALFANTNAACEAFDVVDFVLNNSYTRENPFAEYDICIEKARKHGSIHSLDSSLIFYDAAFKILDFILYNYFGAFDVAVQANRLDKAYGYLCKGTACGLDIRDYYTESVTLFLETKQYEQYLLQRDSLQQVYVNSIDTIYLKELELLKLADQANRSGDSLSLLTDSLNFDKLLELIGPRGYPTLRKVSSGYNIAWLLLWHHRDEYPDSDQWKQIIPIIEQEIRMGEVTPMFFQTFNGAMQGTEGINCGR